MKQIIQDQDYGEIVYYESFFTGSKSISIGGNDLEKVSKKEFKMPNGSTANLTGNFILGSSLSVDGKTIKLTPSIKWYEIVLGIFPILLILIWGNVASLCLIVPIIGGAIGGALGGAIGGALGGILSFSAIYAIKYVKPIWLKIVIAIAALAITFGLGCAIGYAYIGAALS